MPVYKTISAIRPKAYLAGDDYDVDTKETMTIMVADDGPVDTGLVDQFGDKIVRVSPKFLTGFHR